ncbi:MAG: hypothetical protein AAF944_15770 [Bacteroidota bacterium]
MKITPELLKKYAAGKCTEAEQRLVEEWLPGDSDITATFSESELSDASTQMWQHITRRTEMNNPKPAPTSATSVRRRLAYLAIAACFGLVMFGVGYFWGANNPMPAAHIATTSEVKGMLYVSVNSKPPIQVAADTCEIILEGGVKLRNTSFSNREVICNGKTFTIQPQQRCLIFNHPKQGAQLIVEGVLIDEMELYRYLPAKSTFKVCI